MSSPRSSPPGYTVTFNGGIWEVLAACLNQFPNSINCFGFATLMKTPHIPSSVTSIIFATTVTIYPECAGSLCAKVQGSEVCNSRSFGSD
jgi:hypothetical protein